MRGNIILESLERSKQLSLPLPFEFGDVEGLSDKDKELLFPNDQCDVNASLLSTKAISTVYSASLTSDENGIIKPVIPKLKPGAYRIRYSAENETIPFTLESTWSVIDENSKEMSIDEHVMIYAKKSQYEPGDTARLTIGTAWKDASMLMQIESRGKIVRQERFPLSSSTKQINIPILTSYRGGIAIHVSLVKFNRLLSKSMSLTIPWTDKKIAIHTKTLRDKTAPGKKEQMTFSINGLNAQPEVMGIIYDASLDALAQRQYLGIQNLWESIYAQAQPTGLTTNTIFASSLFGDRWNEAGNGFSDIREFDEFNVDLLLGGIFGRTEVMYFDDMVMARSAMKSPALSKPLSVRDMSLSPMQVQPMQEKVKETPSITPRIAMQETAYFSPALQLQNGIASIETMMPDALTRWNIRLFAHDKNLAFGHLDTSIISQKQFMITSHVPRFVRHGDSMNLRASLNVLDSKSDLKGKATLSYFIDDDSLTIKSIHSDFSASMKSPGQVMWSLSIPKGQTITFTFSAESGAFQDAERYTIPILPSSLPITDRYPIWLSADQQKKVITLEPASDIQSLSMQITSEPYWYAIEALPDLLDKSYGSSLDQLNRMMASIFAQTYILGNASIQKVLQDSILKGRLSSNLISDKGLSKSDIGPWESAMFSQDRQARNISIYANPDRIRSIGDIAFDALQKMQLSSGAFPWFASMSESPYITRQILIGFGIAESIHSIRSRNRDALFLIDRTIDWLDEIFTKDIEQALKNSVSKDSFKLAFSEIHHLYARSFFLKSHPLTKNENMSIIMNALWNERMKHGLQAEAMIALIFNRMGENSKAKAMLRSLKERSITDDDGLHWPIKASSWNDADIETHSLILNAFDEIDADKSIRSGILTYLLRQKQTRNWGTPSATFSAVMSLLKKAETCSGNTVSIRIDGKDAPQSANAFPGITSKTIKDAGAVKTIEVSTGKDCPAWGGIYRHRMAPLKEQFSASDSEFSISRQYLRMMPEKGLIPLKEGDPLHLGERIMIRITIKAPTAMNYVQVQDAFPSCFDLMANNSEYRHYLNLWAFIIPRDKTMNFFIDYLPKGSSMMEYEVKVDKTGTFSKGMIKAYSIYAPEYGATNGGGMIKSSP